MKFIISDEYNGQCEEANGESQAIEIIENMVTELAYNHECPNDYVRVFEIKDEWDFEASVKLTPPKPKAKKGKKS